MRPLLCFILAALVAVVMSLSSGVDDGTRMELSPQDVLAQPLTLDTTSIADGGHLAFQACQAIDNGRLIEPVEITLIVKVRNTGHRPHAGIDFGSNALPSSFDPRHRSAIDRGTRAEETIGIMWGAQPRHTGQAVLGAGIPDSLA